MQNAAHRPVRQERPVRPVKGGEKLGQWGATKRATGTLVLARGGEEPQSAGQARRALMRLSPGDQVMGTLQGEYHFRARMLHIECFYWGNCAPERR